ncbi:phosphatidylglycerophosphate phosphatase 1, chloroplastic/mitochondrial [Diospyros lotus]|uniref:phosphatidylglycerophosphate phosphatase 1, chloroplastic/mitochondrial n=1 Tax=Diospyros lotus TaxID=55363 RepID=UPI002259189D|nr:phosphatidylglycerophosphate phosphatase 1, chloroplastic/mitochondrial [Diospyros lotus]
MQSTASIAPWHVCHRPVPKRCHFHQLHLSSKGKIPSSSPNNQTRFTNNHFPTLTATSSCSKDQERGKKKQKGDSKPNRSWSFSEELSSSGDDDSHVNQTQKRQTVDREEESKIEGTGRRIISSNMWWVDLKAALGQRINFEGIVNSVVVVARDRHLALPHVAVPDIRYIDWAELKSKGFRGVVFDKDNTITVPYSLRLWGPLRSSMEQCKSVFGNDIAVFSNSAGLYEFDHDGRKARALERSIGIKVIRHGVKKPAGTAEEIEKHFGCESSQLIMVGDRPFTDIVYGNRNDFLTILTEPLSLAEEPFIVKQVRKLEVALVKRWSRRGLKPVSHGLLPNALLCVKDPTSL